MSELHIPEIVRQNVRRRALWDRAYEPRRGLGCWGEREEVQLSAEEETVFVPSRMLEQQRLVQSVAQAGGFEPYASRAGLTEEERGVQLQTLLQMRCHYDPEFWFSTCVKIKTKRRGYQDFVLLPAQRKFLATLCRQYWAGDEVRILLVKARQWGGSTLTQLFCAWVQIWQRIGWNLAIVADVQQQSSHIRGMFADMIARHPEWAGGLTWSRYQSLNNVRLLNERDAIVGVASAKRPNNVRSFTYHMLHLSEVGLWKSTAEHNAEDLAQALAGGLVKGPRTICVKESTAKGTGNYFHREYLAAQRGDSAFEVVFVGWHEISEYTRAVPEKELGDFVRSWDDREWELWEEGATIEGIAWYRHEMRQMPPLTREWRMKQEYPTTADEAFSTSGRRVFRPAYVKQARETVREPIKRGYTEGAALTGPEALERLSFVPNDAVDRVKVWSEPGDSLRGRINERHRVLNRYCGFLDIGARWEGGDYWVLTILDRAPLLFDEPIEVVAQYRAHQDQDVGAWEAVQLCTLYDRAFLAVEKNSLRKRQTDASRQDMEHHLTVLDEIADTYGDRLYFEEKHDDLRNEKYRSYGFHTNVQTKPMIINALNGALRDGTYVERDMRACSEMDSYEVKDSGAYGAADGEHDDIVVSRAGAIWLALQHMDPVRLIDTRKRRTKKPVTATTFA